MTIAGAFWVGVLAARRLRDWGEGRRALEEGDPRPLAIAAVSGAPPNDDATRRVRAMVADRIKDNRWTGGRVLPRGQEQNPVQSTRGEARIDSLRTGDVVVVDTGEPTGNDFVVEGLVNLREGGTTSVVAVMGDGDDKRWLVGAPAQAQWLLVEPVVDHGLHGEPPRNIRRSRGLFTLERRGQASAASLGRHGRPSGSRVATYVYRATGRDALWIERWGSEVVVGEGQLVDADTVTFLPGS